MSDKHPVEAIIDEIGGEGGATAFAKVCGFEQNAGARGHDMRRRRSIPVRYWPQILAEAKRRRINLTADDLVAAHASAHDDAASAA